MSAGSKPHAEELGELLAFERALRAESDFAAAPVPRELHGADPFAVVALDRDRFAGILRGSDQLQLFGLAGQVESVIATPPSPTALVRDDLGTLWVGGTGSNRIAGYRAGGRGLDHLGDIRMAGSYTARALVVAGSWLYAADQRTGRITAVQLGKSAGLDTRPTIPVGSCHDPVELTRSTGYLAAVCIGDRSVVVFELGADGGPGAGEPRIITHDGPMWTARLIDGPDDDVYLVAGGVEDHPLERVDGGFRYIDSFLFVYRLGRTGEPQPVAAVNVAEHGVVTPKWLHAELRGHQLAVTTAGYGSAALVDAVIPLVPYARPAIARRELVPGTTSWVAIDQGRAVAASPLLDSWIWLDQGQVHRTAVAAPQQPRRSWHSRLGEALLFTTAMAPWNRADGPESRFTCETCHFEAYGDGRVHYTGRGEVHAVTKPLRGLFNNAPHFSRALDRTTSRMVHAEFRVANRFSGRSSWFELDRTEVPWLDELGIPDPVAPIELRRAVIVYLAELGFEANQAVLGRTGFSPVEKRGAELFRDRCASCHAPRLIADDPASRVAFADWPAHIFRDTGAIVWASAEYQKTGIEPYVHSRGTRTPSLRRIHRKYPYFTNGSGRSLRAVVESSRWHDGAFSHVGTGSPVSQGDVDALLAFLELL